MEFAAKQLGSSMSFCLPHQSVLLFPLVIPQWRTTFSPPALGNKGESSFSVSHKRCHVSSTRFLSSNQCNMSHVNSNVELYTAMQAETIMRVHVLAVTVNGSSGFLSR